MKRTPYFMRGVLQGVGGFEIKNYRSFFILSPFILSAFPYHYPSYEVTYYSWGFKYHYSLRQWTVQSTVADRTVHCNGLYSPLPETVVIRRTDGHNRKDENAWSD